MGKVIERVKITNVFEPSKSTEIDALIDTRATMVVLPQDIVRKLELRKVREVKVRYANNKVEMKPVYRAVVIEIFGREGTFDVIYEEEGSQPLIGQVVLKVLDLVVDPRTRKLMPNPASPETPMIDIFMATSPNSGHTATLRSSQIRQSQTSYVCKRQVKRNRPQHIAMGGKNSKEMALFSPERRQEILDRILAALRTDNRIAGVLVVGSGVVGFEDAYSDIDLVVVVTAEDDVNAVFREWRARIEEILPVIHCVEVIYGPNNYLYAFLPEMFFLELDIGFLCLTNLFAKRERWKIVFDRSGKIEDIMRSSWEKRPKPDIKDAYLSRINGIWHHIIHGVVALKRRQPWRALHYLEVIRNRTVELAGLRMGLETKHFRQVDQMPNEFLAELRETLVSSTDTVDIMRALKAATMCFFREARFLDKMLGLNIGNKLGAKMEEYFKLIESDEADRAVMR